MTRWSPTTNRCKPTEAHQGDPRVNQNMISRQIMSLGAIYVYRRIYVKDNRRKRITIQCVPDDRIASRTKALLTSLSFVDICLKTIYGWKTDSGMFRCRIRVSDALKISEEDSDWNMPPGAPGVVINDNFLCMIAISFNYTNDRNIVTDSHPSCVVKWNCVWSL